MEIRVKGFHEKRRGLRLNNDNPTYCKVLQPTSELHRNTFSLLNLFWSTPIIITVTYSSTVEYRSGRLVAGTYIILWWFDPVVEVKFTCPPPSHCKDMFYVPTTPKKDCSKPSGLRVISKTNNAGAGAVTFILVLDVSHGAARSRFPVHRTKHDHHHYCVCNSHRKTTFMIRPSYQLITWFNAPLRRKMPWLISGRMEYWNLCHLMLRMWSEVRPEIGWIPICGRTPVGVVCVARSEMEISGGIIWSEVVCIDWIMRSWRGLCR